MSRRRSSLESSEGFSSSDEDYSTSSWSDDAGFLVGGSSEMNEDNLHEMLQALRVTAMKAKKEGDSGLVSELVRIESEQIIEKKTPEGGGLIRTDYISRRQSLPIVSGQSRETCDSSVASEGFPADPCDYMMTVMEMNGIYVHPMARDDLRPDFFLLPTSEQIEGYTNELLNVIRRNDLCGLRNLHESGHPILCCNKFGESTLHMACRKNFYGMVKYMVAEVGVNIRICDDYGRTPMHDACWTREPALDLVKLLIKTDPDLLLVKDFRGFLPLKYVRKDHWTDWCEFLAENSSLIQPREIGIPSMEPVIEE